MKLSAYRDIISGEQRGLLPSAARAGLSVLAIAYGSAVRLRNAAYDRGWLPSHAADVPVVSVGNLTTGGTGKTPVVAWIVNWFVEHGLQPVILSRGYRRGSEAVNDEKRVLDQLCLGVPHYQDPDRIEAARVACAQHKPDVLILDDGFQHRRLRRDLNIVLIDALDPWGGGQLLPRGLLREPPAALARADLVAVTRIDLCPQADKVRLVDDLKTLRGGAPPIEIRFRPTTLVNAAGERRAMQPFARGIAPFCGIGNPDGFRRTLEATGLGELRPLRVYPDHHAYSAADLDGLGAWAEQSGADALVTTQKDLVKIPSTVLGGLPVWAVVIESDMIRGEEDLTMRLQRLIGHQSSSSASSL